MLMLSIDRLPFRAQLSITGGLVGMCRLLLVRPNRPSTTIEAASVAISRPEQQQSTTTLLILERLFQHQWVIQLLLMMSAQMGPHQPARLLVLPTTTATAVVQRQPGATPILHCHTVCHHGIELLVNVLMVSVSVVRQQTLQLAFSTTATAVGRVLATSITIHRQ